jgi:hypothetical protein
MRVSALIEQAKAAGNARRSSARRCTDSGHGNPVDEDPNPYSVKFRDQNVHKVNTNEHRPLDSITSLI